MDHLKILIVGFTKRTSFSAAKVLLELGHDVLISDNVSNDEQKQLFFELDKIKKPVDLLGKQDPSILDEFRPDLLLPSPGVPLTIPLITEAKKRNIPVIGDIEMFFRLFPKNPYIGITGTDGKTTTTTLTHAILKTEKNALLGGNIGIPIFEHYHKMKEDSMMVLELSSFQLEEIDTFRPGIAACLNVAEDHMDRYDSMNSYLTAKTNIFKNQGPEDTAILNLDSPYLKKTKKGLRSRVLTFSLKKKNADCYFHKNAIWYGGKPFLERGSLRLKGVHNVENAMAAILISKAAGVSDASIKKVLSEFEGLEHRLEFVREIKGIDFYNDSKSTTVNALEKALLSFDRPIVLIAGGRDKGLDFKPLRKLAGKKLKELILIGEAKHKIKKELKFKPSYEAKDMKDAVYHSFFIADRNDVVLLSPGCASFDMFKNYEERGKTFKEWVKVL